MNFIDFVMLLLNNLKASEQQNNEKEYLRLVTLLRDSCNDIIEKNKND